VCFGDRCQRPIVQHLRSALDEEVPQLPVEQYGIPGGDANGGQVCGLLGPMSREEEDMMEQAMGHLPDCADQVQLETAAEGGSRPREPPKVGARCAISTLEDECRFNTGKVRKIRRLAADYSHWRPVRGDGNCFYRTVVFGAIEALLREGSGEQIAGALAKVSYDAPAEQQAHGDMLERLRACDSVEALEQLIANNGEVDEALIRGCRRLVRHFLCGRADRSSPSGLTYTDLVHALHPSFESLDDFCRNIVDPMGRDAETLVLDALPYQLGVSLRLWILDRRDEVELVSVDTPFVHGKVRVHALFKPGHYDLLYPALERGEDTVPVPEKLSCSPRLPKLGVRSLPAVAESETETADGEEDEEARPGSTDERMLCTDFTDA